MAREQVDGLVGDAVQLLADLGDTEVHLAARSPQEPPVRRVEDQRVMEEDDRVAVGVHRGLEEPLLHQLPHLFGDVRHLERDRRQQLHAHAPADHGRLLERRRGRAGQQVDASRQDLLDRSRQSKGVPVGPHPPDVAILGQRLGVAERGDDLLDEQRIAPRPVRDGCCEPRRRRTLQESADELLDAGRIERPQLDRLRVRHEIAQLRQRIRPRDQDEHDRTFGAEPAELADQPERGGIGPVHVLDREQHRLRIGEAAERRRDRCVQAAAEGFGLELLDARGRLAQDSRDERATVLAGRLDELGVRAQQRGEGPVGEAGSVREAARLEPPGPSFAGQLSQFLGEPRLADAGVARDHEHGAALAIELVERAVQNWRPRRRARRVGLAPAPHTRARREAARLGRARLCPSASARRRTRTRTGSS